MLDPREPSKVLAAPAFDSPRGFQLEWVDDTRIISVGHASGSMRKLQLHTVEGDALTVGGALSLDVSPAVLFPHFDPDTSILWLWCKGSSSVLAFDVHPENARQPFAQLPPFNAGSLQNGLAFLPKTAVDVKAVEVLTALRLTAREIQEVSWKVPRRHTDRFQDDVFPPTQGPPSLAADEWKAGQTPVIARIDLRPDGMELRASPLSPARFPAAPADAILSFATRPISVSTEVLKAQPSAAKEKPKVRPPPSLWLSSLDQPLTMPPLSLPDRPARASRRRPRRRRRRWTSSSRRRKTTRTRTRRSASRGTKSGRTRDLDAAACACA